jgi:hypothetical protein
MRPIPRFAVKTGRQDPHAVLRARWRPRDVKGGRNSSVGHPFAQKPKSTLTEPDRRPAASYPSPACR